MTQASYITQAMSGIMQAVAESNALFRIERPSGFGIEITILKGPHDGFRKEYRTMIDCPFWGDQIKQHAYKTTLELIEKANA